ncbi:MAG: HPr family phosphocarrier protein [Ruminococcaceae bacterium]|nr:HPr family phosphocarrier protein [Oscillospiraceae bacterium]
MKTFMIKLNTLEDVRKFVNVVTAFEGEIDLKSGRYTVDAKSIMGIFSLDLLNPVEMTIHCDDCDAIVEKLSDYIVK